MGLWSFSMILVMVMGGGGGGDLLSYMPTDAYWQRQGVEQVSVESMTPYLTVDEQAQQALEAQPDDDARVAMHKRIAMHKVRRLMAIRALGELGDKDALEDLQPLTESDAPFVADYARQAIARLKGEKYTPPSATDEQLKHDLMALPEGVTILGQFRNDARRITLDELLEDMPGGELMPEPAEIKKHMLDVLIETAHRVGNVRFDSVTFAIVGNPERDGHGVVLLRGAYDAEAFGAMMQREGVETEQIGDQTVYREIDTAIAPLNDSRLLLLVGEQEDALPVKDMLAAAKTGDGGLAKNEALMKRINALDRADATAWGSVDVKPWMQPMPVLSSFESVDATARIEGEGEQQRTAIHLQGQAKDADTAAGAVAQLKGLIAQGLNEMKQQVQRQPELKPFIEPYITMMENIELDSDGATATLETKMPRINPASIVASYMVQMRRAEEQMRRAEERMQREQQEESDGPSLN